MASCKDCIHYEACDVSSVYFGDTVGSEKFREYEKRTEVERDCEQFKDRNRFVYLPCKVGDTVYYITGLSRKYIKSANVNEIVINCNGISDLFVSNDTVNFENSFDVFYLTREEAERVLNSSEKSNS